MTKGLARVEVPLTVRLLLMVRGPLMVVVAKVEVPVTVKEEKVAGPPKEASPNDEVLVQVRLPEASACNSLVPPMTDGQT